MLNFDFSEEQLMFRQAMRDFTQREVAPLVDEAERSEVFPRQLYPRLGELGYLAVGAPEELGGMNGGKIMECIFIEEMARVCAGFAGTFAVSPFIVTPIIWNYGTAEQKQRYVIPTLKGELISAIGITEPNAGSDVRSIRTSAVRDGDDFILNGSKTFITNGPIADFVLAVAYNDRSKGIAGMSNFIVEKGTPGFSVARKLEKETMRSSETAELAFDNCRVPATNMVGGEEGGFKRTMVGLNAERILSAARALGTAQAAFDAAIKYAKERSAFGQHIGRYQANSFKLAEMVMNVEAARWLVYHSAWLHDQHRPYVREVAIAKLFASEAAVRICRDAIQIHGGYGLMTEFPTARYMRDALLNTIGAGTSEIQHLIIAKELGL